MASGGDVPGRLDLYSEQVFDTMASGGDVSDRLSLYSDQVFDRHCNVCEDDDIISEAVCYCSVCAKYYCKPCRVYHNKFHRDHRDKLIDGAAMLKTQPKQQVRVTLTTMCKDHGDKVVEMYCYDHDVVCCTVCLAINHKKCTKAEYVPKIADGFSKNPDFTKTKSDLQKFRTDLVSIKSSRINDQTRITKEKKTIIVQIEESRRRINTVFDTLEEAVISGADSRYESFGDNIQKDLDECEAAIGKIEDTIHKLEHTDKLHEAQLFVNSKISAENMNDWRKLHDRIQNNLGKEKIEYRIDEQIQEYLERLTTLGSFVDELRMPSLPPRMVVTEKDANTRVGMKNEETLKDVRKPRTVVRKEDATMRMKKDSYTCSIVGSCCLPDGGTLLSDSSNYKLKLLNSNNKITASCSITNPLGVCYIQRSHEAAVCVRRAIQIVSLGKQMKVVRTIKMADVDCYGLAYCNGLLYVSGLNDNKLYVYEYATGQLSRTVDTDTHGKKIFSRTMHVATNADGTRIWVADYNNGLIELDKHCNVVRVVKIDEMGLTTGVCVDNEDNVYVCGHKPKNVLQLTSNGAKVSTLLRAEELPGNPWSVSYDNTQSRLLVTMDETDTIKVIHFK